MKSFEGLKQECLELKKKVKTKYEDLCSDLIISDIHKYMNSYPERMKYDNNGHYILDGVISMSIIEGALEVIDERGTAFLWLFEINMNNIRTLDLIVYNNRPFLVTNLNKKDIINWDVELDKIINDFRNSIILLEEYDVDKDIDYKYYSDHEGIECSSIFDVIDVILKRDPIIC